MKSQNEKKCDSCATLTPELLKKGFDAIWKHGEAQQKRAGKLVRELSKWKRKKYSRWNETDEQIWGWINYGAGNGIKIILHPNHAKWLSKWWEKHLERI